MSTKKNTKLRNQYYILLAIVFIFQIYCMFISERTKLIRSKENVMYAPIDVSYVKFRFDADGNLIKKDSVIGTLNKETDWVK